MRPRTKSVVSAGEYFRTESAYASSDDESDSEDNWMEIAMRGSRSSGSPSSSPRTSSIHHQLNHHSLHYHQQQHHAVHAHHPYTSVTKGRARQGSDSSFSSRSTLPSWDENDPDLDDDEADYGVPRQRTCSHDRRISFDDDVNVVTIPSRDSYDAGYKRRVWYTMEDLSRMRQES